MPKNSSSSPHSSSARLKRRAIIATSVLVLVIGAGFFVMAVMLAGGLNGLFNNLKPPPNPQGSQVVAERSEAKSALEASFEQLDAAMNLQPAATSTHDLCYKGQNNWKIHDGYAHRCTYRITRYYGFSGDFRQRLVNLENTLEAAGWQSKYGDKPIQGILTEYYDNYYGEPPQKVRKDGGKYLVSDLPDLPPKYQKDGQTIEVDYAEKETTDLFQIENAQRVRGANADSLYEEKNFQDMSPLFAAITQNNKYVLTVSLQKTYLEN